jgi:hypothetical protein
MIKELYKNHKKIVEGLYQRIEYKSEIENENIIWDNDLYINPSIRYGHLEHFKSINDKIEVLHCTFFPSYFKNIPIYGFDVIALNNNVTGLFCDFTDCPYVILHLDDKLKNLKKKYAENERLLPAWANFFSSNFICISPKGLNEEELVNDFTDLFAFYVDYVEKNNFSGDYLYPEQVKNSIAIQNNYSFSQRKNEKTSKALSAYIGATKARQFIDTILFPVY